MQMERRFRTTKAFAVLVLGLGVVALHELYRLLAPVQPDPAGRVRRDGGRAAAATFGDQFQMVLVSAGAVVLTGALALAQPRRHVTLAIADPARIFWIGLGLAHAVLLCSSTTGKPPVRRAARDVHRRHGGLLRRQAGGPGTCPACPPARTVEGLSGLLAGTLAFWCAGYQDWLLRADALLIGAASRHRPWATCSSR